MQKPRAKVLHFDAGPRSPASRLGNNSAVTPSRPTTRGTDRATSRTPSTSAVTVETRQHRLFVLADCADDPRQPRGDAVVCRTLAANDLVRRVAGLVVDLRPHRLRDGRADLCGEGGDRRPRPPRAAGPCQHLAISVLAEDIAVDRPGETQGALRAGSGSARCPGWCPSLSRGARVDPRSVVIWVMMSTGFDATSRIASGQTRMISPITSRKTAAFRPSRSTGVSPGRCATPAAMMTTAAPSCRSPRGDGRAEGEGHCVGDVERLCLGERRVQVDQHDLACRPRIPIA